MCYNEKVVEQNLQIQEEKKKTERKANFTNVFVYYSVQLYYVVYDGVGRDIC